MTELSSRVPLSGWTAIFLAIGVLLALLTAGPLARLTGWRKTATTTTLMLGAATLAMTLTPGAEPHLNGVRSCLPDDLPDLVTAVLHSGGGIVGNLLNALLLLPLAGSLVLTTGRVTSAIALAFLLPAAIELTQTQIPGRYCSLSDLITNTGGALAGAFLGYWWLRRRATSRPLRP